MKKIIVICVIIFSLSISYAADFLEYKWIAGNSGCLTVVQFGKSIEDLIRLGCSLDRTGVLEGIGPFMTLKCEGAGWIYFFKTKQSCEKGNAFIEETLRERGQ
jgi:hypothetical protein